MVLRLFKKIWNFAVWVAFSIGVVAAVLMAWSRIWPLLKQDYAERSQGHAPAAASSTTVGARAAGIHPAFVQSLQTQLSSGGSSDSISAVAHDPKNDFLLVGRESGAVDIWDGRQANAKREIKAHKMRASKLAFSSDGRVFFTNSYFEDVTHVWDTASGSLITTVERTRGPVMETSDPNLFVIAGGSGLRFFDLAKRRVLPEAYRDVGDVVMALAYDMNTDQLGIGTASGGVELWKMNKSQGHPTLEKVAVANPYVVGNWVVGVHFANGGRSLLALPQRGNLDEWSVPELKLSRSRELSLRFSSSPVFIPEKGLLATVGFRKGDESNYDGYLEIIGLETGSTSLVDLKTSGSGVIAHLPSMSSILSGKNMSVSLIDIAKAK
jgi:WD40 repeat protein